MEFQSPYSGNSSQRRAALLNKLSLPSSSLAAGITGWCREREKIDWQETCKFDCQLARTIFNFCCPLSIFTRHWRVARKSNFMEDLQLLLMLQFHFSLLKPLDLFKNKLSGFLCPNHFAFFLFNQKFLCLSCIPE